MAPAVHAEGSVGVAAVNPTRSSLREARSGRAAVTRPSGVSGSHSFTPFRSSVPFMIADVSRIEEPLCPNVILTKSLVNTTSVTYQRRKGTIGHN